MVIENIKPIGWSSIYNLNIASPFFVKKDGNKKTIIDDLINYLFLFLFFANAPCRRVVGKNGEMVGYDGGINNKIKLLEHEKKR